MAVQPNTVCPVCGGGPVVAELTWWTCPNGHGAGLTMCAEEGCTATLRDNAWARIKASGWFQQKDGTLWCPDHVPDWVEAWRAGKRRS